MVKLPVCKCGHPITRTEDWELMHKIIRLLNETFERLRAFKNLLKLLNDDCIASYLLGVKGYMLYSLGVSQGTV